MTKTLLTVLPILLAAGILFLASGSLYFQVYEGQQAIVLQFGRPVGDTITAPGLHMTLRRERVSVHHHPLLRLLRWSA